MQSGTEKRAALAYARAQGWVPPEDVGAPGLIVRNESEANADAAKIADLEVALATERESHEVTKRALERARRKGRVGELEAVLAKLASDDVTEADLDAAKALLK